jgi:hypothetical protein
VLGDEPRSSKRASVLGRGAKRRRIEDPRIAWERFQPILPPLPIKQKPDLVPGFLCPPETLFYVCINDKLQRWSIIYVSRLGGI